MAIYLTNRDGGKTDEAGHYQFLASGFNGNVLKGLTLVQTNPLGMKLNLTAGNARIPYGGYAYSAFVQDGETHEVQIGTANPSNPRIDRVVMYIDRAMARQTVNPNNPGIAKIAVVAGTPAGTPSRPSDVSVNAAVGNNPWIDLADVRVNTGVTQITTANVTDKRVMASAVLGPNAVKSENVDFTSGIWWEEIGRTTGTGRSWTINFEPRRYLQIYLTAAGASGTISNTLLTFNSLGGSSYSQTPIVNGEPQTVILQASAIKIHNTSFWPNSLHGNLSVYDNGASGGTKPITGEITYSTGSLATAYAHYVVNPNGMVAFSAPLTSVKLEVVGADLYGMVLVVLGHN